MLGVLLAATAISGCTTGSMVVSPTPIPTQAPTTQPAIEPTAAPTTAPTTAPQATPTPVPSATTAPGKGPYPTMGPWTPGDDTFIPTPTPYAAYLISSPWIDQKIQVPEPIVLTITGNLESPVQFKKSQLKGYPQRTSTWKHPSDPAKDATGTGPELNAILDAIHLNPTATSIRVIGADGKTSDPISISSIRSDPNAIIALLDDGSLRSIIPSNSAGKAQMKNLVSIQVI